MIIMCIFLNWFSPDITEHIPLSLVFSGYILPAAGPVIYLTALVSELQSILFSLSFFLFSFSLFLIFIFIMF